MNALAALMHVLIRLFYVLNWTQIKIKFSEKRYIYIYTTMGVYVRCIRCMYIYVCVYRVANRHTNGKSTQYWIYFRHTHSIAYSGFFGQNATVDDTKFSLTHFSVSHFSMCGKRSFLLVPLLPKSIPHVCSKIAYCTRIIFTGLTPAK